MKFSIRGYEVDFPHQPYGVQFSFMEKMLRTLDEQGNALLEAPTGCGKTLSLLCAALAWQTRRKRELFDLNVEKLTRRGVGGHTWGSPGAAADPAARDQKQKRRDGQKGKAACGTSSSSSDDDSHPAVAHRSESELRDTSIFEKGPNDNSGDGEQKPPKIFFATRTHSQIAQVVRELKRSGYTPTMAILAAKQHYCINKKVKRTGRVDEECERLLKEQVHGCSYRAKASRGGRPPGEMGVHDIEELSKACSRSRICPYFAARDMAVTAELVFCPYSYLLDPLVRAALGIDVSGSVLIFDEAHNMEDVCREGGSMDLDLDVLREVEVSFRLAAQLTNRPELYSPLGEAMGRLGALLGRFEASTDGMTASGFEEHEAVWQGARALSLLDEAGLGPGAVGELYRVYEQAKAFEEKATFAMDGDAANEAVPASVTRPGAGGAAFGTLGRLLTVLRLMYAPAPPQPQILSLRPQPQHQPQQQQQQLNQPRPGGAAGPTTLTPASTSAAACGFISATATTTITSGVGGGGFIPTSSHCGASGWRGGVGGGGGGPLAAAPVMPPLARDNSGDYRVVVKRWIAHGSKDRRKARSRLRGGDNLDEPWGRGPSAAVSLGLWCFNPAVAFRNLADKAHSVILTSGTLSPLDSFASELGTEFHIRLEAPHVVDMSRQVWASVIPRGPGGSLLSATYRESGRFDFQDDAGEAVLRYCQVIPGGVLLFMPSYGLLEKLMTRWKSTGLWARLEAAKTVVVEPREAGKGFEDAMATYYTAVRTGKGGLFMAVCRGKASEGIDFADDHARGVILLGIPFPAIKDTKVKLKKEYNDAGSGPASGRPPSQRLLTGDAWYNQQAFRALNQAVGRCIRHKYDWGAIILLDERFRSNQLQQQLSRWVRTAVKVQDNFNMSLAELSAFCRGLVADPPRPNMQQPQDPPAEGPGTAAAGAGEPLKASLAPGAAKRTEVAGSRQRGQKGSKGSVDLQYEEDVVSPSDLPGMVVGGAIRTHFDRFRLAAGTSPGKGRNPAATGKTDKENTSARPITSFFSSAGGMSMMAQQVDTSRAAGAAAVASSCCGGGKGFGGGAGMVGGCGDKGPGCIIGNPGDTAHEPTLRTSNGLEPLSMHTQLTTQRYQPPQPGPKPGDTRTHHAVGPMQPLEAVHHQQGHPRDQQTQQEPELQRSPLQQHKQPWSERRGAVPVDVADMQYPSMQSGDHHPQYQPFLPAGGADGGCVSNANLQSVSSPTGAGSPEPALAPASHCSPAALEPSFRPPLPRQTPPTYSTPPYGAAELLQGKAPGPPPPHSPCQQHQQQPPERQQYSWSGQPHQWQYQRQWLTPQQQQQQQQQQQPPNFQGSHTAYSHAPQYPWQRQGHDGQVPHGTSATWGGEPGEGQGRMQLQHQWKGPEDQQHRSWDGNMPYWQTQPQPQSQPQGNTQLQGQEQGQWWRAARQDLSCQGTRLENQHEDQQPPPPLQQPPGLPYNRRSPPSRLQANPRAPAWVSTSVPLPAATALQQGPPSFRQQPGAQSTPQQAQQGACLEQHPRHSEFIRERAAGVSQVAIPFQHASAQPRPAQPSPLQWQLPPGPLQQNQTQYPSKPSQQPQWQPPPRQYQHQQYQQYQHQHQQLPLQYRRLGCESASGSGAHSDDCGGQQQVGRYPDEQAQKQEPKSLPYQQLNQPQQAFAGQSGAAGQGVTDDREPSREGGVSGQRVISTTTYGGHISACREVVGTGAGPNNIAAASSWQPGSTMGIGGRPLKKLTSSRAREAAKKRRRVNQENGTGQGPGNGSQWDSIDEEDDFV